MNIRFFFIAFIVPAMLLLSGCGIRNKNLLRKLSPGLTKKEVRSKMGKPHEILCPVTNSNGDIIDIWEYSLATVDENQENKRLIFQLGGWFLFWPLLCVPAAWESPYSYDIYFLKFVNELLSKWGRRSDLRFANATRYKIRKEN